MYRKKRLETKEGGYNTYKTQSHVEKSHLMVAYLFVGKN